MNKKSLLVWLLLLGFFIVTMTYMGRGTGPTEKNVSISEFIALVEKGEIKQVEIAGANITAKAKDDSVVKTYCTNNTELLKILNEKKVPYKEVAPSDSGQWIMLLLKFALPLVFLFFIFRFMNKAAMGGMNKMNEHASHKAEVSQKDNETTFADVAGIDEAVEEVRDLVDFLKNPQKFTTLGGRTPKGTLLAGPSGTGKTLLARAVAGEAKVPFFSASAAGFVEMFVGVGAARVRDLFEKAKKSAPCIIFIDELDAVGRKRGGVSFGGGHDEREQTLNELLVQMDGFKPNQGVIVIAATNRPDVLDSALTRAGRFDRQVIVPNPDVRGREAILKVHSKGKPLDTDVDLQVVARGTPGMTGADLEELLNEASLRAAKQSKKAIGMEDILYALDKVLLGAERRSAVINPKTKRVVAYHEAGHTIVGWFTPECDPVRKVSIIPRGMAGGVTLFLPHEDKTLHAKNDLTALIKSLLGGRAAEEMFIGDVSTGASNDLERATDIARRMVCDYAMGEKMGLRTYGSKNRAAFLDYGYGDKDYSEETARRIDEEIAKLTDTCYQAVKELLQEHRDDLERLAKALLDHETLDEKGITELVGPRPAV
jgi:cell division protease FtsH